MRKFPSDKDGLFDFEEINFNLHTRNGQPLITFNSDGTVNLPNLNNLLWNYEDEYPYVASGFDRFKKDQALKVDFYNVPVLPIKSDPTSEDGDGDGHCDNIDKRPLSWDPKSIAINNGHL